MLNDVLVIATSLVIVVLVIGAFTPICRRWRLLGAVWAVVAATLLVVLATGPRWTLVPVALAAGLGLLTWRLRFRPGPGGRRRSRLAFVGSVLTGLFALGGSVLAATATWALPTPHLPAPTGEFAVGTSTLQWDTVLAEPGTTDPTDSRVLVAQLWFPTAESGPTQRYLPDLAVGDAIADQAGLPAFLLDGLRFGRTNSIIGAPVVEGDLPLVIFSPGLGGVRTQNSAWAEELASHGYFVAAIDHPYDSAAVVLDDGTVVRSTLRSTGDDDLDQQIADELARTRADDLIAAIDRLQEDVASDHVIVAGHSIGGAAAILAAADDDRVDAVINLDGLPRGGRPGVPILAIVAGGGSGSAESDARYHQALTEVLALCGTRRVAPGAQHLSFTDAALFLPPLPSLIGQGGRTAGLDFARNETLTFLADVLRDDHEPCEL